MKAFLLAAGLGTRLRPLTNTVPKCLVPIAGRPLLAHWIALLQRHGFDEVLVNVHHLPDAVRGFIGSGSWPVRIRVFEEPVLLGSAGTVRANAAWVEDGRPFLVAYADNLTNVDLSALVAAHETYRPPLTMGLFRSDAPEQCGIAEVEGGRESGRVVSFEEKPEQPRSNLANAGLYVTDVRILARIPDRNPADFGRDVLPGLVGEVYGHAIDGWLIDVGTPESYGRAQRQAGRVDGSEARP